MDASESTAFVTPSLLFQFSLSWPHYLIHRIKALDLSPQRLVPFSEMKENPDYYGILRTVRGENTRVYEEARQQAQLLEEMQWYEEEVKLPKKSAACQLL